MTENTQLEALRQRSNLSRAFHNTVQRDRPMGAARLVRRDGFLWPDGNEIALITKDGSIICSECVTDNWDHISWANANDENDGWLPSHVWVEDLYADHNVRCGCCNRHLGGIDADSNS